MFFLAASLQNVRVCFCWGGKNMVTHGCANVFMCITMGWVSKWGKNKKQNKKFVFNLKYRRRVSNVEILNKFSVKSYNEVLKEKLFNIFSLWFRMLLLLLLWRYFILFFVAAFYFDVDVVVVVTGDWKFLTHLTKKIISYILYEWYIIKFFWWFGSFDVTEKNHSIQWT